MGTHHLTIAHAAQAPPSLKEKKNEKHIFSSSSARLLNLIMHTHKSFSRRQNFLFKALLLHITTATFEIIKVLHLDSKSQSH